MDLGSEQQRDYSHQQGSDMVCAHRHVVGEGGEERPPPHKEVSEIQTLLWSLKSPFFPEAVEGDITN